MQVYVDARTDLRDDQGRQLVVRNGHPPQRSVLTGIGPIEITQPRLLDRRPERKTHAPGDAVRLSVTK